LEQSSRIVLGKARAVEEEELLALGICADLLSAELADVPSVRACDIARFYKSREYRRTREQYPVLIRVERIGNVDVEVVTPSDGIPRGNEDKVLINLHAGAFLGGNRTNSQLESAPMAVLAGSRVVSVDYRLAPEASYPAATEDVLSVYREILKTYTREHVGIYGCSAGGLLAAELMAALEKAHLPRPAALALLSGGALYWTEGDSGAVGQKLYQWPPIWGASSQNPYFANVKADDPEAFPGKSPDILARFPPTLLVTGTRDFALSSVVKTHFLLIDQGVEAELHVFEGMEHVFFHNSDLLESRAAYRALVAFFNRHVGLRQ
jgi:acetyl esterase/lipase